MASNLEKYKADVEKLLKNGQLLLDAFQRKIMRAELEKQIKKRMDPEKAKAYLLSLPDFHIEYQSWYSETKAVIRQLLPDRLDDFTRHYEKPKVRKDITFENYRIEDALQGLTVTRGYQKDIVVDETAALPHILQQLAILLAAKERFASTLFDIRKLVQADILDSEIEASRELLKNGYVRPAGALAGVIIERHLYQVCSDHLIKIGKKNPGISDLIEELKNASVIDVAQWRSIQYLADLRNLCSHKKTTEPSLQQVSDLLDGAEKILKTIS